MYEHSDRAAYVTEQVSLWLSNDYEYYQHAQVCLKEGRAIVDGGLGSNPHSALATSITMVLRRMARPYVPAHETFSAAWHVARELAPNDYARIDWSSIAADLEVV